MEAPSERGPRHPHPPRDLGRGRRHGDRGREGGRGRARRPADEHQKHGKAARAWAGSRSCPASRTSASSSAATAASSTRCATTRTAACPVFGINFGTIGFLAAVEREHLADGLRRALAGDLRGDGDARAGPGRCRSSTPSPSTTSASPASPTAASRSSPTGWRARRSGNVRCDGLVAATPAGSTGYNLANAGPILAWGVEGYVVSFIAPHTLTARALVVAPGDVLQVRNAAGRDPVDVALDGDPCGELAPGEEVEVRFRDGAGSLAQLPGRELLHAHAREVRAPRQVAPRLALRFML